MGGGRLAREGLSVVDKDMAGYRQTLYGAGSEKKDGKAVISREETVRVLEKEKGKLPMSTVLRCRVRYFTDGMVLGSEAFVAEQMRREPPGKRERKVHPMRGADWERHGWDTHYGYYDHAQCHGFYPPYVFENGSRIDIPGNTRDDFGKAPPDDSPESREARWNREGKAVYSQDIFDDKILEFLRKQASTGNPFFLYHPSQLPHGPISIPEIDPAVKDNPDLTDFEKECASMVLRLDRTVGLILDELDRLGLAENTLVMFASDNGHEPYYVQDGRTDPARNIHTGESYDNVTTKFNSEASGDVFDGNDGMSGKKFSNWEGGVRLPFMARWPGVIAPGGVTDHLYANYDLMATIAEITGARCPAETDGLSCLPELRGERDRQARHEAVIFASGRGPGLVTPDGWKLKQVTLPDDNLYQLYHLPDDRLEENDLKFEERGVCERLSTLLLRECDGNFLNGAPATHQVWLPGVNFFGPECHWDIAPTGA